MSEIEVGII